MNFLKQHFSKIRFITYFIWMIIFLFSGIIFSYYGHKLNDNNIILQGIVFSTGIMILGLKIVVSPFLDYIEEKIS